MAKAVWDLGVCSGYCGLTTQQHPDRHPCPAKGILQLSGFCFPSFLSRSPSSLSNLVRVMKFQRWGTENTEMAAVCCFFHSLLQGVAQAGNSGARTHPDAHAMLPFSPNQTSHNNLPYSHLPTQHPQSSSRTAATPAGVTPCVTAALRI